MPSKDRSRMSGLQRSKAALVKLSRTLASWSTCTTGIAVNAVVVGRRPTAQAERTRAAIRLPRARHRRALQSRPAPKRPNRSSYAPDEAARTLVLLADDDALMTGATIALDRRP
jgi:NAD(P)-dependent dehydrogenase (short-subunit alcohol dehydrogenase family)